MHFTGTVYRNPYWPTWPLLEITQGCTHNRCKFCTMYKDVRFGMSPLAQIEADLAEIADITPHARTIQLLSANPLALSYDRLMPMGYPAENAKPSSWHFRRKSLEELCQVL